MKPSCILSGTLFLAAWLLAVVTMPTAHAREATDYERFCLATMGQIESTLAAHLPGDCKIVATHPSPLGRRFAGATQIRDAWISRNGKVVAKVVMFTWPLPDDPLLSGATVSQVRLETDRDGKPRWGGLLPTVIPHLDRPFKITSKDGPGYVLFVPAHESIQILLTHKEDRPGKFKGRVVYDPVNPRDGAWEMTKDGPPWKDEWLFSNEFEYEVVAAGTGGLK